MGKSARLVFLVVCASCSSTQPPVQTTEARAIIQCNDNDTWEECIPAVRHESGEDASGERGPAQKTLELAVAFCSEHEPWKKCIDKIRSLSGPDAERDACMKNTPKEKQHRCQ